MVTVSLRVVVIPAVLVGAGLVWEYAPSHEAPPAPSSRLDLVPNPEAVPDPIVAPVEPPPPLPMSHGETAPIDIVPELNRIGASAMQTLASPGDAHLLALGTCTRPTAKELVAIRAKLIAWIDHTYPNERSTGEPELQVGCKDPDGLVVEAHVDRGKKKTKAERSRWWILRVGNAATTVIAERTSSATENWMEWEQEGMLDVLALADLDGDGSRDILYTRTEHEGGATSSDWDLTARLATGERKVIAMHGTLDVIPQDGQPVLAIGQSYEHLMYRCIGHDLALTTCPAAVAVRRKQAVFELAQKYSGIQAAALPDREQLADDLAMLGVAKVDRTRLAAAVPAPTPLQRAQRHVAAFVAKVDADDDLGPLQGRPHAIAESYFASLRNQLGDTPCPTAGLSAADTKRLASWLDAQPVPKKMMRQATSISPACGAYAWVGWDEFSNQPASGAGIHREVLLALDAGLTRVLALQVEATGDPTSSPDTHRDSMFRHGATVVIAVQHGDKLDVIANNKVVAHSSRAVQPYMFDALWADASDDLLFDPAAHAWFHPTPSGLEKIDPEPLAGHEARREALELVRTPPLAPTPVLLHALGILGAEPALVREVRALVL